MKRISTFFALIAIALASQTLNAQTCKDTTTTFASGIPVNTFATNNEGFGGDFTFSNTSSGSTGVMESKPIVKGTTSQVLSSTTYRLAANAPFILFGFDINGSGSGYVKSFSIAVRYINASGVIDTVQLCTSLISVPNSGGSFGFYAPTPVQLQSSNAQSIQLLVTFNFDNNSNGNQVVDIDNFKAGVTLGASAAALPVNFIGLEARSVSNGTQLTWKVAQEENVRSYELQRSTDGANFTAIGTTPATGSSSYSLTDNNVNSSVVYYRVKNADNDGHYKYSITIRVDGGKVSFLKRAYPLPAVNEVYIQHNAAAPGAVITLSSQDGRVVKNIAVQGGSMQTRIELSGLSSGLYLARFDNGSGNAETLKVVKQ